MIILIAAIAPNNVIGKDGKTPWHISEELKLFQEITYGHAVIMGRKTYESIEHVLPGRRMFVLSRSRYLPPNQGEGGDGGSTGVTFCSSIQDALDKTKHERSVFVIGGGQVYAEMMPLADEMRISFIHKQYSGDIFFPHIDSTIWKEKSRTEYELFTHIHYIRNEQPSNN